MISFALASLLTLNTHAMQETVEEIKEKVTEMAALMESLQMSISVLQKNNRHLYETVKEVCYICSSG